ncbi:regulator of G-protein signaling 7-binding protein, partial [Asbolus verrucosus]
LIIDINGQVALFRDLLIHIGQTRDCPELREKIRKLRRSCVEACKHTSQLILPQLRSAVAEGIPADNPHLVLLFFMSQLFLRELTKCHRLVQIIPMDMSGYYGKLEKYFVSGKVNITFQITEPGRRIWETL